MRQLFEPGADAIVRLALFVAAAGTVMLLVVAGAVANSDYVSMVGVAPTQPVPFSHKHHSGELGLDCRYCHATVETEATAGMPPTYTCMTCHSQIWTGAPMLAPVRDSLARQTPLKWTRVNRLPDYVYFNHAIHVSKGIGCSSCHGDMTAMQMTLRAQAFHMDFCLQCHRNPAANVRPIDQVLNTTWQAPPDQMIKGRALVAEYHIRGPAVLTDCSTCHR